MTRRSRKIVSPRIFTIGHSNRTIQDFLEILKSYKLKLVIDIRTVPKSRHNPQFEIKKFGKTLARNGIEYVHMSELGGFRHSLKNSVNTAWRNSAFRGYADYMQTKDFTKNLKRLIARSKRKRLVMMCAEAVPWRCHRSLVGDALLVHGLLVEDIFSIASHRPHHMTSFAKVRGKKLTYPSDPSKLSPAIR